MSIHISFEKMNISGGKLCNFVKYNDMGKIEDRNSQEFKAKEAAFYSDCQIYTSEIESCRKTEDNPYMCESKKAEAREERKDLENKRQMLIDEWKEEHGEYDQEKAYRTRIDGSKIPSQCYGNYWVALEEQEKNEEECECEDEEEYGM